MGIEQKLIKLGYKQEWTMGFYKTIILSPLRFQIAIYIKNNTIFDYKMFISDEEFGVGKIKNQQDINNLQQAFYQMQKDLEILKECEE